MTSAHRRVRRHVVVQRAPRLDRPRWRRHVPQGASCPRRATRPTSPPTASITYRRSASRRDAKTWQIVVADGTTRRTTRPSRVDVRPPGSTVPDDERRPRRDARRRAGHRRAARERHQLGPRAAAPHPRRRGRRAPTIVPDFAEQDVHVHRRRARHLLRAVPRVRGRRERRPGLVRVDVLEAARRDLPPVAVRDVALLPTGGDVLVNVLANDIGSGRRHPRRAVRHRSRPTAASRSPCSTTRRCASPTRASLDRAGAHQVPDLERLASPPRARSSSSPFPRPTQIAPAGRERRHGRSSGRATS